MIFDRLFKAIFVAAISIMPGACRHIDQLLPVDVRPMQTQKLTLQQEQQALRNATPCCTSFADFSYQRLLPSHPKRFKLVAGNPVANLDGAPSYFLDFKLPQWRQSYRIGLKSEMIGRWLKNSYLFAPTVTLLDSNFQPLQTEDISLCEYLGWDRESSGAFGSITVSNAKAQYLLLYSSMKQQQSNTYWEQTPVVFATDTPSHITSSRSFKVPHGPNGNIWIGQMNKNYANAIEYGICEKPEQGLGLLQ